jgi:hypothetical protein
MLSPGTETAQTIAACTRHAVSIFLVVMDVLGPEGSVTSVGLIGKSGGAHQLYVVRSRVGPCSQGFGLMQPCKFGQFRPDRSRHSIIRVKVIRPVKLETRSAPTEPLPVRVRRPKSVIPMEMVRRVDLLGEVRTAQEMRQLSMHPEF